MSEVRCNDGDCPRAGRACPYPNDGCPANDPYAQPNWWDDRTMPNNDGPDWHRDTDGVLWQVDPRTGDRRKW